jgi:sulfur relay (sulfurtransferase) complex TusBCD TusD component (DsrE family)
MIPRALRFSDAQMITIGYNICMNICLLINPTHHWQESLDQAVQLACASVELGATLHSVFFYGSAVLLAEDPAQQETWLELTKGTTARLLLCRTMLEHYDLPAPDHPQLEVVGMASLASAMEQADRTMEIG